ncbi:MAG TPA: site-2 protease family protein, partial [Candidatus Acidoferrum sp.]|nr:site-2 protease family protein [Candidatus Acidoferrum sp.]
VQLLNFTALLSINLAILNLLPIPVLDGGHLLFSFIEWFRGKPISLRKREIAQQVGMVLLVGLMIFAFYNDISRWLVKP